MTTSIPVSTVLLTCQRLVQKVFQLHQDFNVGAWGTKGGSDFLRLLQLLVKLVPQCLNGLPVVDVHFILQCMDTYT